MLLQHLLTMIPQAKDRLNGMQDLRHEYLPITGLAEYLGTSQKLVFGASSEVVRQQRIASMQTLSGTGALHLGALFLARWLPDTQSKIVYVSDPPYVNHLPILHHVSLRTAMYPYYSRSTKRLDLDGMIETLKQAPIGSIVLLHACAHNPTGMDPSQEQWRHIARIMKQRQHIPFFDSAYQGFASGSIDDDAWSIRYLVDQGFDTVIVAQSYAKNLGLYGERAGCLHIVAKETGVASRVVSQLQRLQRVEISTPPAFGARIASTVLNTPDLFSKWQEDLQTMSGRIKDRRHVLRKSLESNGVAGDWSHITQESGMFSYTGLTSEQVKWLRSKYHIYMTNDGRISVAGLNTKNTAYVAEAFKAAINHANP